MDTIFLRKSSLKQLALVNKIHLISEIEANRQELDYVFFEGEEGYVYKMSTKVLFCFNYIKGFENKDINNKTNKYLSKLNSTCNSIYGYSSIQNSSEISVSDLEKCISSKAQIFNNISVKINDKRILYDNSKYYKTFGKPDEDLFYVLPCRKALRNDINLFTLIEDGLVPKGEYTDHNLQFLAYKYYINNEIIRGNIKDIDENIFPIEIIQKYLLESEYRRIQTEIFNENVLLDYRLGLWELYKHDDIEKNPNKYLKVDVKGLNWHSRNPKEDMITSPVAIDFGTSSTVVAYQDGQKAKLLRIGSYDIRNEVDESDYENPTVLQFFDIDEAISDFSAEFYKPETLWSNIISSHRAMDNLKQSSNDTKIVTSIFPHLKLWANHKGKPYMFKDAKNKEFVIENHSTLHNKNSKEFKFDPIEYYAYLLGLFINRRKIYTKFYLTFPVKFSTEVRKNILESFKNGLIRSVPYNLIDDNFEKEFSVKDYGIEPIAYLVTALREYDLLEKETVYYSVFDFGGGTADFAYGKYRPGNEKEEEDDIYYIIENFSMSGDSLLGGENILNNLAYQVFTDSENISICREYAIPFFCPPGEDELPGLEYFLDNSTSAYANMSIMRNELRNFWLNLGKKEPIAVEPISAHIFLNKKGEQVESSDKRLSIPIDKLKAWVYNRIFDGIKEFVSGFRTSFKNLNSNSTIHVFLSGNASKSLVVQAIFEKLFGKESDMNLKYSDDLLEFVSTIDDLENRFNVEYHLPLLNDTVNPEKPNCKTGTALGLLEICNNINNYSIKEKHAKFNLIVGKRVRDNFDIIINSDTKYNKWYDFGKVNNDTKIIDILFTNQQSVLLDGKIKYNDERLKKVTFKCKDNTKDLRCYIAPINIAKIKIAFATDENNIEDAKAEEFEL
jgi:hypothetical protein